MIVHDIEQRTPEWYTLRAGLPTASEFSKIITSKGEPSKSAEAYAMTLAGELFAGKPLDLWEGNIYTERGRELEEKAIQFYEFTHDITVTPVGFVTNDANTMGCSPDGHVDDKGMVEVKCLKAENHIAAILRHQKNGTIDPKYIQQTQGQMLICEREWCDLIFYHPELPPLTVRQAPDKDVQDALKIHIPALCAQRDKILEALKQQSNPERKAA